MIYLIYLAVGLAAFIYGAKHDRKEYNSTVKDILFHFVALVLVWPLFALFMLVEWLEEDSKFFQKILRKVVIKRRK